MSFIDKPDIKSKHPDCEACFIEIMCDNNVSNPVFGALYRHPRSDTRAFNNYLGEFLENVTANKTKLTILGDLNIDINKSNPVSHEYINTLSSVGFSPLINQPTRIFYYENSNSVSASTIDHIISNCTHCFSKSGILIADVSDHLPIFGLMSLKPSKKSLKNSFRRHFRVTEKEKLLDCLNEKLSNMNLNTQPDQLL